MEVTTGTMMASGSPTIHTVEGHIMAIDGKWVHLSDGERYSVFNPSMIKAATGDYTRFKYKIKPYNGRDYRNIVGNVLPVPMPSGVGLGSLGGGFAPSTPPPSGYKTLGKVGEPGLHKDRLILRQNAGTTAASLVNTYANGQTEALAWQDIQNLWKEAVVMIEGYTSGDDDFDAANKLIPVSKESEE